MKRKNEHRKGTKLPISPATVNRELSCLRKVLKYGIRRGYLTDNPVRRVDLFAESKGRLRHLSQAEQQSLLAACHGHLTDAVLLDMRTGLRRGELLGLKVKDVDFETGCLTVHATKTRNFRYVPMVPEAREILERLCAGASKESYVFRKKDGSRYHDMRTSFRLALERAQLSNVHFHDLRHTYASDMVAAGVSVFEVKELLGHASVKTTMIYAHLSKTFLRGAMQKYEQYLGREDPPDGHKMAPPSLVVDNEPWGKERKVS